VPGDAFQVCSNSKPGGLFLLWDGMSTLCTKKDGTKDGRPSPKEDGLIAV